MTSAAPRPIPGRQSNSTYGQMQMPSAPQPQYPPPSGRPVPSDIRGDAATAPLAPGGYAQPPQTYGAPPPPNPYGNPYGTSSSGYQPQQVYGNTPPQAFHLDPQRVQPPPQTYGTSAPAPSYIPQQQPGIPPQSRLHPADAVPYGTTPPMASYGAPPPQGRSRRGTGSSIASSNGYPRSDYGDRPMYGYQGSDGGFPMSDDGRMPPATRIRSNPRPQRRSDYDYDGFEEGRRRRRSDDAGYRREKERRRSERKSRRNSSYQADDFDRRPTVGDSTMWAINKLKGAFSGK